MQIVPVHYPTEKEKIIEDYREVEKARVNGRRKETG